MDHKDLNKIIELHAKWLNGDAEGRRADLRYADLRHADLRYADLRHADLRCADLRCADLTDADLRRADLRCADLRCADLTDADLTDADLTDADLHDVVGNMKEIKSMQIERYQIAWTTDRLQIGCKNFTHEEWWAFSDAKIAKMDDGALEWWKKWKDFIRQAIELSK